MWLLIVGIAIGVAVTGLLRAMSRYEAASTAAMQEQILSMQETVESLQTRVESLEVIAADDRLQPASDHPMPEESATPLKTARLDRT